MKVLLKKYPKGTIPNQQTDGRYVDETLYKNIEILAKNIVRDMTYLTFIFSSTFEVGTGKSVFVSQLGEIYTELVNTIHKKNLNFDMNNCVFKPSDLIARSFKLPKYSAIILDEWTDAHYWSELGMSLRQFFRKCRQLNLCIFCIIPNFFQLPISYAISRSVAAIDVSFQGEFERGFFAFYNFKQKKNLYIKGKKFHDYDVVKPNFIGRFTDGYGFDEQEYRQAKFQDMLDSEKDSKPITELEINRKIFKKLRLQFPQILIQDLVKPFNITTRTATTWLSDKYDESGRIIDKKSEGGEDYSNNINSNEKNEGEEIK